MDGVGSIDPNDKIGSQGAGAQRYVSGGAPFAYSIYFANEDTATAPAQQVVITDQLDTVRDDLSTFRFGPITFGNQFIPPPPAGQANLSTTIDLRPANNILVAITANLSASNGLLTWNFQSLDPSTGLPPTDPTAGFLPPGVGGSTFFTIAPRQSLITNTQIQNQATIVFDSNLPISTPIWLNTLDKMPPSSLVQALPTAESASSFTVQWSGSDLGAGIQDFTVYVSEDGSPFTAFLTNTPSTSATFQGRDGHTYAFYSLGRDFAGNLDVKSPVSEATTSTPADSIPPSTFATLSNQASTSGWNSSNVTVSLNSLDDPGGSGVKQLTYAASGAQPISSTTVGGATTSLTISAEGITAVTFFGTDNVGNVEAANTLTVRLDKTPPSITGARSPAPNVNGWNNSSVTASFQCADALSGLAAGSPPAPTVLAAEGAGQSATGTCTDLAGNGVSVTVQPINIDMTAPALTPPSNQVAQQTSAAGATVTYSQPTIVETGSGLASSSCLPASGATFPVGLTTVACTATDLAGNTGSATFTVTVNPVNRATTAGCSVLDSSTKVASISTSSSASRAFAIGSPAVSSIG